jgi:signal transduction histidine kinase
LAVFYDGVFAPNGSFPLQDTPCNEVVGKSICFFPHDVRRLFPHNTRLQEMAAESYIGTTLWSSKGQPIGLIAVISRHFLANPQLAETLLKLVAIRASAELERRQAEAERRKLEERMNQVQRLEALGFLSAGISHNLNNALAAILGLASLRESITTDTKDREAFGVICKASERGRDVLESLLRFARSQLESTAPLELNGVLHELHSLLGRTTRMRVSVIEAFAPEPVWILGDAGSLSHAFMNLCVNAIHAMPEGGVLTLRTGSMEADWVEVSVEDTGEGMTPEILAHALEPFYTTKPVGQGTGLGLSMAYGAIKAHGGTLDITSSPTQGTLVKIRIPRIPEPLQAGTHPVSSQSPGSLQVLLVDDDELIRLTTVAMLESVGCLATAVSGVRKRWTALVRVPFPTSSSWI